MNACTQCGGSCHSHESIHDPCASCAGSGVAGAVQKYDDVLLPFLSLMRKELHANSSKGDRPGWLRMDPNTALLEIYWHTAKLSVAVNKNDGPAIMEHSADVANMAMMLLDVCGGLAFAEPCHGMPAAPVPLKSTGTCHHCGNPLRDARYFCNHECLHAYEQAHHTDGVETDRGGER